MFSYFYYPLFNQFFDNGHVVKVNVFVILYIKMVMEVNITEDLSP